MLDVRRLALDVADRAVKTPSSRAPVEGSRPKNCKVDSSGSFDIARHELRRFRQSLLAWYRRHRRDLPWRHTRDPYAILLSEVMLQQTQAAAVVPYYIRWLRRFPTVQALAQAGESDVLHAWQGLGYYARARNLHRCARIIAEKYKGTFPPQAKALQSLPGIGRYTANAIAVFAFNRSLPLVEANTSRVLARLLNLQDPIDSTPGRRRLWEASASLVPPTNPRDFQNAMMDLGSLICTARHASCHLCPVKKFCRTTDPTSIPRKRKRPAIVSLIESHCFCRTGNAVLLEQSRQRWRGMWILPPLELDWFKQSNLSSDPVHTSIFPFTNHRIRLQVYRRRAGRIDRQLQRWFHRNELEAIPIPSPHRRALIDLLGRSRNCDSYLPNGRALHDCAKLSVGR